MAPDKKSSDSCDVANRQVGVTRSLLILASLLLLANPSIADILNGRVVGLSDGDTVTVLDASNTQFKIRLMGIDAPEKKQAFGNRSKESLSALIFNKQVSVEYNKKDKYGRIVGKIFVDGADANLEQVKAGMAWHYKQYQKEQSMDELTQSLHGNGVSSRSTRTECHVWSFCSE